MEEKIYEKYDKAMFGERIKKRRDDLNLTQKELARIVWRDEIETDYNDDAAAKEADQEKILEVKRRTISHYENGKTVNEEKVKVFPDDLNTYFKICQALQCEIGFLLGAYDSPIRERADLMEMTGITDNAAKKLKQNAGNYYTALSAVLESEAFWGMLELIESYVRYGTDDAEGKYIDSAVKYAARAIDHRNSELSATGIFNTLCNRYTWKLMEECKQLRRG